MDSTLLVLPGERHDQDDVDSSPALPRLANVWLTMSLSNSISSMAFLGALPLTIDRSVSLETIYTRLSEPVARFRVSVFIVTIVPHLLHYVPDVLVCFRPHDEGGDVEPRTVTQNSNIRHRKAVVE